KDTVVWNIEQGLRLSGMDVARAEAKRTRLYHSVREFMGRFGFLILPVSEVAPFPVETDWVREINGVVMKSSIASLAGCSASAWAGVPGISGATGKGATCFTGRFRNSCRPMNS